MAFEQNESGTESEVEKYKNMNFYERLGVTKDTPQDQIRKAYITQMRKFQAGLSSEPGTKEHEDTTAILQFINEAYETLKDVDKRSYYDVGGSSNRSGSRNRSYRHQEYQKETENARREQEEKQKAREKEEERLRQEMEDLKKRREQKERLEGFIEAAKQGPYVFKRYTKEQKVKGIEENFIVAPEVFKIIKEEAIRKAQFGARIYDNYVKEWVKDAQFDRRIIDTNSNLIDSLKAIALKKGMDNKAFLDSFLKEWKEIAGIEIDMKPPAPPSSGAVV